MNAWEILDRANRHRLATEAAIAPLSEALDALVGNRADAGLMHVPGDGWCVLLDTSDNNAALIPVGKIDFTLLFGLDAPAAIEYLLARVI